MEEPMYTDDVMSIIARVTQHFFRRDLQRISHARAGGHGSSTCTSASYSTDIPVLWVLGIIGPIPGHDIPIILL
jgi:hypothetical protein